MAQPVKYPPAIDETQEVEVPSLGWEYPLEGENVNPLQYRCLKNPMDRRAWQSIVQRVTKSQTEQLSTHASLRC